MGYSNRESDDFQKLRLAFTEVTSKFGSVDNILESFGLSEMPMAQRYGILFGFIVFVCTVSAVIVLLVMGGTFQRIKEQAELGDAALPAAHDARSQRALLMEQLLEASARMQLKYASSNQQQQKQLTEGPTELTIMLGNVAPEIRSEDSAKVLLASDDKQQLRFIPPFYEANYCHAYQTCQDKPGGKVMIVTVDA
jgi:hypothetical protein